MEINIKGGAYVLRYTLRAFMLFESITGKTYNGGLTDNITLFYCCVVAAGCSLDFNDFIDLLDEEPALLPSFLEWLSSEVEKSNALRSKGENDEKKKL